MFKRDTLLAILFIAFFLISITLLAINISQEKIIQEQNRIIALQSEYQFDLETTINLLEQQLEDERLVSDTLYDLADLHGILQEVE